VGGSLGAEAPGRRGRGRSRGEEGGGRAHLQRGEQQLLDGGRGAAGDAAVQRRAGALVPSCGRRYGQAGAPADRRSWRITARRGDRVPSPERLGRGCCCCCPEHRLGFPVLGPKRRAGAAAGGRCMRMLCTTAMLLLHCTKSNSRQSPCQFCCRLLFACRLPSTVLKPLQPSHVLFP
jgi:hypothetical protein